MASKLYSMRDLYDVPGINAEKAFSLMAKLKIERKKVNFGGRLRYVLTESQFDRIIEAAGVVSTVIDGKKFWVKKL